MAAESLAGKRVLIVDDSATVRTFIAALLREHRLQVEGVATGRECLDRLEMDPACYDLILLDLILPDTDGIQVLREIRSQTEEPTVVVITGMGGVRSAIASVREGADGYIQKEDVSVGGDHEAFLYWLEQAMERRAGILAARQLEAVKAELFAIVAHDLRSPTNTIQLALDLLTDPATGPLNETQQELVHTLVQASHRLHELINDYLDFIGLESGKLQLEFAWVDPRALLEESVRMAQIRARLNGQQVQVETGRAPSQIWADGRRLKQVFDNLIVNALKYTPRGGTIWIRLWQEGDRMFFQVQDTGIGLDPELIPRLFDKFRRADNPAVREIQGTGLGLFIVREIVEAHGGTVWAESPGAGQGSTFTVAVPIHAEGSPSSPATLEVSP